VKRRRVRSAGFSVCGGKWKKKSEEIHIVRRTIEWKGCHAARNETLTQLYCVLASTVTRDMAWQAGAWRLYAILGGRQEARACYLARLTALLCLYSLLIHHYVVLRRQRLCYVPGVDNRREHLDKHFGGIEKDV
jgi:hypothetical protein